MNEIIVAIAIICSANTGSTQAKACTQKLVECVYVTYAGRSDKPRVFAEECLKEK